MIDMIFKHSMNEFDVVSKEPIEVGSTFYFDRMGISETTTRFHVEITEVVEKRKQRGLFVDEKNRGMWARVLGNCVPQNQQVSLSKK